MNTNGFWNHHNSNRCFLYKNRRAGTQTISYHLAEAELSIQGSTAQRHLVPGPMLGWRCWHFQVPAIGYHQDQPSSLPPVHLSFQNHRLPIYQIYWCATLWAEFTKRDQVPKLQLKILTCLFTDLGESVTEEPSSCGRDPMLTEEVNSCPSF